MVVSKCGRSVRRFFWWCAAADASVLDAPDTPRLDGIKYAAVGALVCLTTTVAICGWIHNAASVLPEHAYTLPLAGGVGLLMGALVFCMERVLVVSIRQEAPLAAKLGAFAWRALIASLSAAVITTPFALAYFNNGILAELDREKLALMAEKQRQIDALYGLKDKAIAIATVNAELADARKREHQLPPEVEELFAASTHCDKLLKKLRRSLYPRIAGDRREVAAINRELAQYSDHPYGLRRRRTVLMSLIVKHKKALTFQFQACRKAADVFKEAKAQYYARLSSVEQALRGQRTQAREEYRDARRQARALRRDSDAVVDRVTAPDSSARAHALGRMAARDGFVRGLLIVAYGFFFLIDMMPILAKLVMRTVYELRYAALYRREAALAEADAVLAETEAAIRTEIAKAEQHGVEALQRDPSSVPALDLAKLRAASEVERAEVAAAFARVDALIEQCWTSQVRADDLAERYQSRPDLLRHIEIVREALAQAMGRAASSVRSQPSATPS